ncbi:AEC family transporter [Aliikangiella sp. IMCC44359]|uniref:AEC family transporter n=1 Tax=Aliikangiella sp. IMCC44359 TaxID=3459125 RepID=UPI00403B0009
MINFIIIAVFLVLGILCKKYAQKKNILPSSLSHYINTFVIYVCLPAIVLLKIPSLQFDHQLLLPVMLPWVAIIFAALFILLANKIFHWQRPTVGCLLMLCCFGNTSFFGFPMVNAFFGEQGLPYAIVYDLFGSFLGLAIVGNIVIALYSEEGHFNFYAVVRKVILFPPLIAVLLSLCLKGWIYPAWLEYLLVVISWLLVPSTMFLVGMHMSFNIPSEIIKPLQFSLFLKLFLLPIIIWGLSALWIKQVPTESLAMSVSIFEAAMPPMVTASVMAIHANLESKLAATAVGVGLLLSCMTLTGWYFILAAF